MRIAVADDNQEVLFLMKKMLKDLFPNNPVFLYENLRQLEHAVVSGMKTFDLLFLDIRFGKGETAP